jgi:transposase-like protein
MATLEITLDDNQLQTLLRSDDRLQQLLESMLNQLLQAEMTEHLKAAPSERTDQRKGYRNGRYQRKLTTRVGTLELDVPRDREGRFQTELFERYQRSEKALVLSFMDMYVSGVSTRKVKRITRTLCGQDFSKSTVSKLCTALDTQVRAWCERPLDAMAFPFLIADAIQVKVRRQGAVRATTALLAIGINEAGYREILGLEVAFGETGQAWQDFFRALRRRGLYGVDFATSDAHEGLVDALESTFPGVIWQRCQAHFMRNVLDATPEQLRDEMHEHLMRILRAATPEKARAAFEEAQADLDGQADKALLKLEAGFEDATAVLSLPAKYRRRLRTTNMLERFNEEIRRRERVVRIFPNVTAAWRLIGALSCEQHEAWSTGRVYLCMEAFFAWKAALEKPEAARRAA